MRIDLLVQSAPFAGAPHQTALRFAGAAADAGHDIGRVFFYKDAVAVANRFADDDGGIRGGWVALAQRTGCELAVCVAAAGRRGVKEGQSLADGFAVVGLGQLVEAMEEGDRLVGF